MHFARREPDNSLSVDSWRRRVIVFACVVALALVGGLFSAMSAVANTARWSIQPAPSPSGAQGISLMGVSCSSPAACIAVGYYQPAGTEQLTLTLAERWDGSSWSILPTPNPSALYSALDGVSCISATNCVAVGKACSDSCIGWETLVERWDGSAWTVETSPDDDLANDNLNQLASVSCSSADACTAVGDATGNISMNFTPSTLTLRFDGAGWSLQTPPSIGAEELAGVSCPTDADCTAVGSPLAAQWTGGVWVAQTLPDASATSAAVSCSAPDACTLVGYDSTTSPYTPVAERWDGSTWTVQSLPNGGSTLYGVACTSGTSCTAVGDGTLIELWNGTGWSIVPSPNPSDGDLNVSPHLQTISCSATASCVAVGWYVDTAGVGRPLVEAETATATPEATTLSSSLSGGGQSGATISVPGGTAVTDSARLTGTNATTATGTVSHNVYSDPACTTLVTSAGGGTVTGGVLPSSSPQTFRPPGTYYWQASYSGDSANQAATSSCGNEVETVTAAPTALGTSLSGGGQSGATISVPGDTAVTDSATLAGANASTATGTMSYSVYSDSACTKLVASAGGGSVSGGVLPGSSAETFSTAGTYYWQASYSGDSANQPSAGICGSAVETVTAVAPSPKFTRIRTVLSGNGIFGGGNRWWRGDVITVFAGAAVTDSATLHGTNAASARGTVTYNVYSGSNPAKAHADASGGKVTVTHGVVPNSRAVTLANPGIYYWQASYSGDPSNDASVSRYGSESELVIPVTYCNHNWNWGLNGRCVRSSK
ncbi:MAG: hypothetical protein ACLP01_13860 [Solirubrobacteraceae bacterium]